MQALQPSLVLQTGAASRLPSLQILPLDGEEEVSYLVIDHLTTAEIIRVFSKICFDGETGCWNWTGRLTDGGYGKITFRKRTELVHRLVYAWLVKPIPQGRSATIPNLDHTVCDNEACCNPSHIKLGPQRDNILRGTSPSAVNARKTHCPNGHLLPTRPNTPNGERVCKTCRAQWAKNYVKDPQRKAIMTERSRIWMIGYRERKRQEKLNGAAVSNYSST